LPAQVSTASLMVYDLSGKQISSFPITEKGSSSITITSEKLAAGIYIYSVIADGKLLDSKRMIVAQK
jgi:myo-inositol-hexaphosphate 3-phosphohydrolase